MRGKHALRNVVIDFEVTSVCDASCAFCPRELMPDKKRFVGIDVVEHLALQLRKQPVSHVVLAGIGEPALHPDLDRIVRVLADTGTWVEMTTHGGARMDPRRLGRLVDAGLRGVNFSLNAATADTHRRVMRLRDFETTTANVIEILERMPRSPAIEVNLSSVVCDLNAHEIDDFVETWRPRRPSAIWLHPLNNRNRLLSEVSKPVDMDPFVRRYKDDPLVVVDLFASRGEPLCRIAHLILFVSADGVVRLCAMDYRRVTSFGSIPDASLEASHVSKISRWLGGEFDRFCEGCDFYPDAR